MKLIIQIPCLNEAQTLPATLADLPKSIPGIDVIEVQVVDDGSTDGTAEVARAHGVHHVVSMGSNRGLARAFSAGVVHALAQGADILVNTDADNQYRGEDIAKLVPPILENNADIVVGCRPILEHPEFTPFKKALQIAGSWMLRKISKTTVRDAPSGFRAFSRTACQRLFIHSTFSYCIETLVQAGNTGLRVASVDIRVNPQTRPSRLFKSVPQYLKKTGGTMIAMFVLYRPGRFFALLATPFLLAAAFLGIRFVWLVYGTDAVAQGRTFIPSLILLAVCAILGFLLAMLGVIATLMQANRRLNEEEVFLLRCQQGRLGMKHR